MEMKSKALKTNVNGEIPLLEPLIHHIQSFMTGREAAQTMVLSKPWHTAWLTRPNLEFDQGHFKNQKFEEFTTKSMQRYEELDLKVDSFKLRIINYRKSVELLANEWTAKAIRLGATDLNLELWSVALVLPQEVIKSETLLRLSVSGRKLVDGNVKWSRLRALSLLRVHIGSEDVFKDIISCCNLIEELSLSHCRSSCPGNRDKMFCLSAVNLPELSKLRCLSLESVEIDSLFFTSFASRFPCLKDLSVSFCVGYKCIQIHSSSLETIKFEQVQALNAEFHVPSLMKFSYSGAAIPYLTIESSKEWEYTMTLTRIRHTACHLWFPMLKESFTKIRPSKIYLCMKSPFSWMRTSDVEDEEEEGEEEEIIVVGEPLVLEKVTIEDYSLDAIMIGLFRFCRPKFLTLYWLPKFYDSKGNMIYSSLNRVCKRLMNELITPTCGIPDQNMFGKIGLKEVNVELYEEVRTEWRPLLLNGPLDFTTAPEKKRRILFQLSWL